MKKVLIISPHFPPVNAADMHRVRQSLPYFREFGWEPVVVAVDPDYVESSQDPLLLDTLPDDVEVVKVKALNTRYTRRVGLGSLALRSMVAYYREVSRLLKRQRFDLIYFSTTMFPLPALGRLWKRRFGVPYIIDMQDPWLSDYYLSKPKHERPPKFWFSHRLSQLTEPFAMKKVDGILAVSEAYNKALQSRYLNITTQKCLTLTFAAFDRDFDVLEKNEIGNPFFDPNDNLIHIPYIGRAGHDMHFSLNCIFDTLSLGLKEEPELFSRVRLYFIGTSYAAEGKGVETVVPLARQHGLAEQVVEVTDRIPYFQALKLLKDATMLLIPGSDDPKYTASKLYSYILARKPLLAVFHKESSVVDVIRRTSAGMVITYTDDTSQEEVRPKLYAAWQDGLSARAVPATDWEAFITYSARSMTEAQTTFFDRIIQAEGHSVCVEEPSSSLLDR